MSTLQRSFIRAGVNLKYSEGFNPHPYISSALPLPVGAQSLCELADVAIADNNIPNLKDFELPEGLAITEVYVPGRKFNDISWIEINGELHYDNEITNDLYDSIQKAFKKESIIISKRTKRGFKELDLAPYIKNVQFSFNKNIEFNAKISAQNPTINAVDIESVFDDLIKPDYISIKRIELYDTNMVIFN